MNPSSDVCGPHRLHIYTHPHSPVLPFFLCDLSGKGSEKPCPKFCRCRGMCLHKKNQKTITSCVSACTEHIGRCCRHHTFARSRSTSRQLPSMPSWLQRHQGQESESKRAKVSESERARARERVRVRESVVERKSLSLFLSLSTGIHILKASARAE